MPVTDLKANAGKANTDTLASEFLNIDPKPQKKMVSKVVELLPHDLIRLCITGGAGSGKSTTAEKLGEELAIPVFDFDDYITGGWTENSKEYRSRLVKGLMDLWQDLPNGSWIIEHVEACHEDLVNAFKPTHALLVTPPPSHQIEVAKARSKASADSPVFALKREKRALESTEYARMQFEKVPGPVLAKGQIWILKKVAKKE